MKVLAFTKYSRRGASSRLRTLQYIPLMQRANIVVDVEPLLDEKYLSQLYNSGSRSPLRSIRLFFKRLIKIFDIWRYDLVLIEYELFPYFPAFFERILKLVGVRYVVDYDDAVFHNYDLSPNFFVRSLLSRKIDVVMRNASGVMVGNAYLKRRARQAGVDCILEIPTVVDTDRYTNKKTVISKKPIVGWIGSPSTQDYIVALYPVLKKVSDVCDFRLLLIGASPEIRTKFIDLDVEVLPWEERSEVANLKRVDIGIMPLIDGPWEQGKCGYKLIQYMACSIPVIGTPIGVNQEIIIESRSGLTAESHEQWIASLKLLLSSPSMREELGKAGRVAVEQSYSIQAQAPRLISFLKAVIDKEK